VETGRRLEAWGYSGPAWLAWRSTAGLAQAQLGDAEQGRALIDDELQRARLFGAPRPLGVALRAAGLIEAEERAVGLLSEAVAVLASSFDRLEHARGLIDLGATLRRSGHRGEAVDRLREGLDLASRCGATPLADRARSELGVAGARPRRDALRGRDALTASELRVARMAAAGSTNKRIAQDLFVSLRTVETHLTHAYQKLGIGSRAELTGALGSVGGNGSALIDA
jgi:DNA-binding NarL/FixJ family response regulator